MIKRLFFALTGITLFCLFWYLQAVRPVTLHSFPEIEVEIASGESVDQIANKLSNLKLIRSRTAFKFTVIRLGLASKIQAGFFKLSPNESTVIIANKLTKASTKQTRVTLPEGLRRHEMALIIHKALLKSNPETTFSVDEFIKQTTSLEGQLFPDTYDLDPKTDTQTVISRLTDTHKRALADLKVPVEKQKEIIIIASLLEREAGDASEMKEIAGVISNRLKAGWPLQIDATVQYIIATNRCKKADCDWWPVSITKQDLQIKSPFNTYANPGLPPAPISNPGKDSLSAALSPASTPFWFYLHDAQGVIHFAKTVEEHNQNVCLYLKKDCR